MASSFRLFLAAPSTGRLLDQQLADNAATDAALEAATCLDCTATVRIGPYCDGCRDRRDTHAALLKRRLVTLMATATAPTVRLTALEISLCVTLIGRGWTLAQAIDRVQAQRGQLPFTPPEAA